MSVWCVAIHKMPTINEITAKMDYVLFTCNCFFGLRKRAQHACSCRKAVSKISANLSNCDEVYFKKRIISTTGEWALKKNSTTFVFLYCDINQFNQSMEISFFFLPHFLKIHRSVLHKITIDLLYFWDVYDVSLWEKHFSRSTAYSCRTNILI